MRKYLILSGRLVLSSITASLLVMGILRDPMAGKMGSIHVGSPFPGLSLPSAEDGTPLSITSYRGEKLILHIFASW